MSLPCPATLREARALWFGALVWIRHRGPSSRRPMRAASDEWNVTRSRARYRIAADHRYRVDHDRRVGPDCGGEGCGSNCPHGHDG